MTLNLNVPTLQPNITPQITVIGVGGAGGNAVNNMIQSNLEGVDFLIANTDAQAIQQSLCDHNIQLGRGVTQGLGSGSKPDVGRAAAEEALYSRGGRGAEAAGPAGERVQVHPNAPPRELETTAEQRRADALGLLTEWALVGAAGGDRSRIDRCQVVVHVEAEELGGASEPARAPATAPAISS